LIDYAIVSYRPTYILVKFSLARADCLALTLSLGSDPISVSS